MQLDWRIRLSLVIGGVVLLGISIAGVAWGDLDPVIVDRLLSVIGTGLTVLGVAGGPSRGASAAVLVLALCWLLSACSGSQSVDVGRCSGAILRAAQDIATSCWPRPEESCPIPPDEDDSSEYFTGLEAE